MNVKAEFKMQPLGVVDLRHSYCSNERLCVI